MMHEKQSHTGAHGACQWVCGNGEILGHSCMSGPMPKCGEVEVQRCICTQKSRLCSCVSVCATMHIVWCGMALHGCNSVYMVFE